MVTVLDRAGHRHQSVRDTRKGDPDDPLTDSELAGKFAELRGPVLGAVGSARLAERLWRLGGLAALRDLPRVSAGRPGAACARSASVQTARLSCSAGTNEPWKENAWR